MDSCVFNREQANTLETMVQEILTISRLETAGADFKKDRLDCIQMIKCYLNEKFVRACSISFSCSISASSFLFAFCKSDRAAERLRNAT